MQDNASGNSGRSATDEIGPGAAATPSADGPDAAESGQVRLETETGQTHPRPGQAPPKRRGGYRRRRLVTYIAGGVLGIGIGLGVGGAVKILGSSGSASASSVIPSPPRANDKFVEDDNGTGPDNQQNILTATAPGLVHIVSSHGASVGLGLVLTPSGIVLTSNHILQGAAPVTARVVLSGRAFTAKVVGSDAAEDLALLQIEGGSGFRTVAIGNSQDFPVGSTVTSVGSRGSTKTFTLYLGNVTTLNGTAPVGGRRLAGLLQTTSQALAGQEIGGPLVNLSGQVIGVNVAEAGNSLHSTGFAIPVNKALAVAKLIDAQHS
jgi:S1-C subfamily serine protease